MGRARIAAVLGQHERAVQLLREAISQGFRWDFRWGGHLETDFESLRDYEPFQELVKVKG